MPDRLPWQRIPEETPAAFRAFRRYRDAGPGRRQADGQGKRRKNAVANGTITKWCSKHGWVARSQAWDDHIQALAADKERDAALALRVAEIEEEARQRKLRLDEARALRAIGRAGTAEVVKRLASKEHPPLVNMPFPDLLDNMKHFRTSIATGQNLERLELGEATQRQELTGKDGGPIAVADHSAVMGKLLPELASRGAGTADENPNGR